MSAAASACAGEVEPRAGGPLAAARSKIVSAASGDAHQEIGEVDERA